MLKFWVWPGLGLDAENAATDIAIAITKIIERHRTVRRKVERLAEALRKPEERDEAADAIRALIEKITLTPGAKHGELAATLHGDLQFPVEQAMNTLTTITV